MNLEKFEKLKFVDNNKKLEKLNGHDTIEYNEDRKIIVLMKFNNDSNLVGTKELI